MIIQVADKHSLERKDALVYFNAPNTEPNYVYLHYVDEDGQEPLIELDSDAIIELGKQLEARKNGIVEKNTSTVKMNRAKKILIKKILFDLDQIKAGARCVPRNVAPEQDKGIYFDKVMLDLEGKIKKYKKLLERI